MILWFYGITMKQNYTLLKNADQVSLQEIDSIEDISPFLYDVQEQNDFVVDEREDVHTDVDSFIQIDPYVTSYVSLLAPRFSEHLLSGDIAEYLHVWMNEICISFGWQLQFIDVRPEYLHWIMAVSIGTSPTQFMKTVRSESSKKIFDDFPKFKQKNLSTDFWAPAYYVNVGQAPYSQKAIKSFIMQIRSHQGLL